MPLDFKRASDLFLGTEEELALALGVTIGDLRAARQTPERVAESLLQRLADVLVERGKAMTRVGQLLQEG